MKAARALAGYLLVFPLVGTVYPVLRATRAKSLYYQQSTQDKAGTVASRRERLQADLRRSREAYFGGSYQQTIEIAETGFAGAVDFAPDLAARFLINSGGAQFALRRFQGALTTYRKAHELAIATGESSTAAILTANIASLYSEMGENEAAARWLESSLGSLTGHDREQYLPMIEIQLATLRARQDRFDEALSLFGRAIDAADRAGTHALYATAWNRVGEEFLRRHDPASAEWPLLEAWRVRKLHRLPLDGSLLNLAKLNLAQGDRGTAEALLDRAVELTTQPQGMLPTWDVYLTRGRLRLERGRPSEALDDLRIAVRLARAWRWSAPADEASRTGTEGLLHHVYSALIEGANRMYLRDGDPARLRESLDAAEENRAASLRALISGPGQAGQETSAGFWEAVARLQRAEVAALRSPGAETEEAVARLRAELVRMEAGSGPDAEAPPRDVLNRTRAALAPDTAVFAFHLGESGSWLWALDRRGGAVYPLPPAREIADAIDALTGAILAGNQDWTAAAVHAHDLLFSRVESRFLKKPRWLVAPDRRLFDAPFSALATLRHGRAVPLAQSHSIQALPGLSWLFRRAGSRSRDGSFVGVGDAIYNAADTRYSGRGLTLNLPRLAASSAEIEACSREWNGGGALLLTGPDASRLHLLAALQRRPAVVHIAAHVVESTQRPSYGLIALSPDGQAGTEVLTPQDIARWRTTANLVVINGCSSGSGAALPGTGLIGLTRAWLAAGASAVVASRWPTADNTGTLFRSFYRHLRADRRADPASALHRARREMIAKGGWQAHPRLWAAYFVIGAPSTAATY